MVVGQGRVLEGSPPQLLIITTLQPLSHKQGFKLDILLFVFFHQFRFGLSNVSRKLGESRPPTYLSVRKFVCLFLLPTVRPDDPFPRAIDVRVTGGPRHCHAPRGSSLHYQGDGGPQTLSHPLNLHLRLLG